MIKKLYAVYDTKAKFFTNPFVAQNDMVALRLFASAVRDPATDISKFPVDYTLFRIGEYDDEKGMLFPLLTIENLGMGSRFGVVQDDPEGRN